MPKRSKIIYPKSIYKVKNKFHVGVYSRKLKKNIYVGSFDTVEDAIFGRDSWIVDNYDLVEGYLPRGVSKTSGRTFQAQLSVGKNKNRAIVHIGYYDTIEEAMEARKNYILSLL